jgi:4-alpha-glucanotransferase
LERANHLTALVRGALTTLGIERLVFAIHDQSFPSTPDEDIGRGSPYAKGANELLRFLGGLGFDGIQFGPQGDTSLDNPSPYDGALFTRSPLSIALATLREDPSWEPLCHGLLQPMAEGGSAPDRVSYDPAWKTSRRVLAALHERFAKSGESPLRERFAAFRADEEDALAPDGAFEALTAEHGSDDWRTWRDDRDGDLDQWLYFPGPARAEAAARRLSRLRVDRANDVERHLFGQFVLYEQHLALRRAAASAGGLSLFGDLQIGFSHRDVWSRRALFRTDYLMGAPPSRTNPGGQPWGYPVLDPELYFAPRAGNTAPASAGFPTGPALGLIVARVDRMLRDFDGLRLDHPHGLVCPWVYSAADPDPAAAVQRGARLFCSPNLPEHPRLAGLAIPDSAQISADPGIARYADDWVRDLRDDQVARYGVMFDAIMAHVAAAGRRQSDVVCEVLSTWPYPLRRVMQRHGLGRFCVTQKADLARPDDVYRSENASERDWIMVGNHDTQPVWRLAENWHGTALASERALYLAERLMPRESARARLAHWIAADARNLCQAMFADLFVGKARRVSIFYADLFGLRDVYNRPGVVDAANWRLRLPGDFAELYRSRVGRGEAVNLPFALALATRANAERLGAEGSSVSRALFDAARSLTPSLDEAIFGGNHAARP